MSTTITNNTTAQVAVALLTITSAAALALLSFTQSKSNNSKKRSIIMPSPTDVNNVLPNSRFVFDTYETARGQSLFTINLPPKTKYGKEAEGYDPTKFRGTGEHITDNKDEPPPKAMLFLVHGITEHCCRSGYIALYESLSLAGVDVYSLDHVGHGRSDGLRGYVEKFEHYVDDLLGYIRHCQQKYIDRDGKAPPLVLMGQSMGALICVMATLELGSYHVGGMILTSAALGVEMDRLKKIQKFFAPTIDRFAPKARIVDGVRPKDLSRNQKNVQEYINDPLIKKGNIVARTAIEMDKTFDIVKERRGEITCPILMMHGTDDHCTSIKAAREFFEHIGTGVGKKKFLELQGFYHEILEEGAASDELIVGIVDFASRGGQQFIHIAGEEEAENGFTNLVVFEEFSTGKKK